MKPWADPLEEALVKNARLVAALREARGYLLMDDQAGRACPDCRGVERHFDGCGRALAVEAIRNALGEAVEA